MRAEALITETLKLEETRFRKTLERGLTILDTESAGLSEGATFSGETAFTLYDTYGFPLDLTQDALRPRGIVVDTGAFDAAMQLQKQKARAAWAGSGEAATDTVWFSVKEKTGATEFLGYDTETAEGQILAVLKDGAEVAALAAGETGLVVVNQTPFYGESGGQQGDRGSMAGEGFRAEVTDTQKKLGDLFVHVVSVTEGRLAPGQPVLLSVDHARRSAIRSNHSATHLLHEALRQVLGDHVAQKGSLVSPDRLRFDFSHNKPIGDDELAAVEDLANRVLLANTPVVTRLMGQEEAVASGARALFGEKYGDEVRVVSMGPTPEGSNASGWSVELCGGTHVARTGDIGLVTVVGEGAVAAGVRRIEAMTGDAARRHLAEQARKLEAVAALVKTSVGDVEARVEALVEDRRRLERELAEAKKKLAMGGGAAGADPIKTVGSVKLLAKSVTGIDMRDLKGLADAGKAQVGSGVVAIVGVTEDGKAGIVVGVTPDLAGRVNAVDLVRLGSEALGGKGGGGRPDMAQAGGPDGSKADEALAAIEKALAAA